MMILCLDYPWMWNIIYMMVLCLDYPLMRNLFMIVLCLYVSWMRNMIYDVFVIRWPVNVKYDIWWFCTLMTLDCEIRYWAYMTINSINWKDDSVLITLTDYMTIPSKNHDKYDSAYMMVNWW
jgi:hypothetical protein